MKTIKIITFLIATFLVLNVYSQNYGKNDSILVYTFINKFEKSGINNAIDFVYSTNSWINADNANIENVKSEVNSVIGTLGAYYGYDFIKKSQLSNCLVTYSFIMRFDKQPIRFVFVLYKPKDEWRFQLFNYDGNIIEEMQNSMNITWDF